jgi:hypothetical protein
MVFQCYKVTIKFRCWMLDAGSDLRNCEFLPTPRGPIPIHRLGEENERINYIWGIFVSNKYHLP